ncbi:hypothetical protein RHSIM_Rhsim08G0177100 [Rhododendron simsii]|uniref:Uncharacterized protein n=1 Tax=Rhododendron simsii TaxID=118357 RepID=A0A834GRC8_RHOSS|nr:hypothetical protein RHSIM_Rhsim08G0177100 [Rhododendron simsii]
MYAEEPFDQANCDSGICASLVGSSPLYWWISGSGGVPSLYLAAMAADEGEAGCRPRTMREMLRNKKLCTSNIGASPLELPFHVPMSTVVTITTVTAAPIEESQQHLFGQLSMAEIEQRIESRLSQRFKAQFELLKAQMFENMDSRGLEAYRQVLDAESGHRTMRKSVGDDNPPLEQKS